VARGKRLDISFGSFDDGWDVDRLCDECGENMSACTCRSKKRKILSPKDHRLLLKRERRRGKIVTLAGEFHIDKSEERELLKRIKRSLGCGGTFKDGWLELQGEKSEEAMEFLKKEGFAIR